MSFYNYLERNYGPKCKITFKNYSNYTKHFNNIIARKKFLINCRKNHIFPKFITNKTNGMLTDITKTTAQYNGKRDTIIHKIRRSILNYEIMLTFYKLQQHKKQIEYLQIQMLQHAPQYTVNEFIHRNKQTKIIHLRTQTNRLNVKLNKILQQNKTNTTYSKEWFMNMTNYEFPDDAHMILAMGPKFAVKPTKDETPICNIIADIEHITKSVDDRTEHNNIRGKAATIFSNHLHRMNSFTTKKQVDLNNAFKTTKLFIKNNPDIIITEADKGNVTIAMYRTEYEDRMTEHFSDKNKYRPLTFDPTEKLQKTNNDLIRMLHKNNFVNKKTKRKLLTFTAKAPQPRATIKLHKHGTRIIVNSKNSPSYNISSFLNSILTTAEIENQYNFKNSFVLKKMLDNLRLVDGDILVSFDVISMYDRIPMELVDRALKKRWQYIEAITPIPWEKFQQLVKFAVRESNYVEWNGKFYKQIDGLTIGGCVSGILADFVVTDIINNTIYEAGIKPTLTGKYVDDLLMIVSREEVENIFTILNAQNKNIQFTMEIEEQCQLPYLDILIERHGNNTISTNYYQKPTNSNRLLNYESEHPKFQKTGMAYGTISRILNLSSKQHEEENIKKIHYILEMNGYPHYIIQQLINKHNNKQKDTTIDRSKNMEMKKYRGMLHIPQLTESLRSMFITYDPTIEIGYKPAKTVKTIINASNNKTSSTKSNHDVIYAFNCKKCEGVYIGQTGQKLKNRIKQHKAEQLKRCQKKNMTAALQHVIETGHSFDLDGTKILAKEKHLGKRLTLESLHINIQNKTTINLKSDIENLNPAYVQLLKLIKPKRV